MKAVSCSPLVPVQQSCLPKSHICNDRISLTCELSHCPWKMKCHFERKTGASILYKVAINYSDLNFLRFDKVIISAQPTPGRSVTTSISLRLWQAVLLRSSYGVKWWWW